MAEAQETSDYPATIDTWASVTNKEDDVEQSDINKIKAAIEAVQTELGENVAGSVITLVDRLALLMEDDGSVKHGTSFPSAPITGQIFFRTDTNKLHVYNSAWTTSATTVELFDADGTWTCPSAVGFICVTLIGGGGGASGGTTSGSSNDGGAGGGGGACILNHFMKTTGSNGYVITVGDGGTGGAAETDGVDGGDSTFAGDTDGSNYTLTAPGGSKGTFSGGVGTGGAGGAGNVSEAGLPDLDAPTAGPSNPVSAVPVYKGGDGADAVNDDGGGGGSSWVGRGPAGKGGNPQSHGTDGGVGAGGGGGARSSSVGGDGGRGIVMLTYNENLTPA